MTATSDRTATGTTFESLNPRTGDVVGTHPVNTPEEVQAAVDRAKEEAAWWGALSFDEREKHLRTWKGAMTRRLAQLAEVMHRRPASRTATRRSRRCSRSTTSPGRRRTPRRC